MGDLNNKRNDLNVVNVQSEHFDRVFNMQKYIQLKLGDNFESNSLKDISDFLFSNNNEFVNEASDMMEYLKYKSIKYTTIEELSDEDIKNLKTKMVDMFRLFINLSTAIGMTGSELFSYFIARNKEIQEK